MKAIKKLKEMDYFERKSKWPEGYEWGCPKNNTKLKDSTANGLTQCIIRYLELLGYQAERVSTMGRVVGMTKVPHRTKYGTYYEAKPRYARGSFTPGTADVSATIEGRSVKIEVKIGRDTQSEKQKAYADDVRKAGGIYYIAKDFQSFHDWLHDTLIPTIQN